MNSEEFGDALLSRQALIAWDRSEEHAADRKKETEREGEGERKGGNRTLDPGIMSESGPGPAKVPQDAASQLVDSARGALQERRRLGRSCNPTCGPPVLGAMAQ